MVRNAPLIIPPDYTLTPPVAGTAAISPTDAQAQAIEALFGGPAPRSAAETSLLDAPAATAPDREALDSVGDPNTRVVDKGTDDAGHTDGAGRRRPGRIGPGRAIKARGECWTMAEETLSARLVDVESMIDRSRRRFDEGTKLIEEAHRALADIQQALIGSPTTLTPEDSEEASSRLLASLKAAVGKCPKRCATAGCRSTRCSA